MRGRDFVEIGAKGTAIAHGNLDHSRIGDGVYPQILQDLF
jgi:hypothetical protein